MLAVALRRRGERAVDDGNLPLAYTCLRRADLADPHSDKTLFLLAFVCTMAGRYEQAIRYADRRVAAARVAGDHLVWSSGLAQRGEVYMVAGRHLRAAEELRRALAVLDRDGPRRNDQRWAILSDLGSALAMAGHFGDAFAAQYEAYALAVHLGEERSAALAAGQLSLISGSLGQPERALEWAEASGRHLGATTDRNLMAEAEIYGNRALAFASAGRPDEARQAADRAIGLGSGVPLLRRQALVVAAEVARRAGRYDDAAAFAETLLAEAGNDARHRALGLNTRAVVRLRQSRVAAAVPDLRESLALKRGVGDKRGEAVALMNLVRAHLDLGEPEAAGEYAGDGERLWNGLLSRAPDEAGLAGLYEQIAPAVFQAAQEVRLASGDVAGALAEAERGRSGPLSALLRAVRPGRASVPGEPPGLDRIRALARRLNATLIVYTPHFDVAVEATRSYDRELREVHMWGVTPGGAVDHHVVARSSLLEEALAAARDGQGRQGLPDLGPLLVHPLAGTLPADASGHVVVLPLRFLWGLPFAAYSLPDGGPLIERCSVSYAPSIHALELLAADGWDPSWRPGSALAVGGPRGALLPRVDGTFRRAPRLEGSVRSAEEVARIYGVTPMLDDRCTVAEVRARLWDPDVIHIAAHASLDAPLRLDRPSGAIALTPAEGDHGQLSADLIESMPVGARLVVLAICSSGMGMLTNEGVRGLVRAFLVAGASGVLATLWEVPDHPAREMTTWFHEHLVRHGDPAAALRHAMLKGREWHPDPRIWAAFALHGLPRPIRDP